MVFGSSLAAWVRGVMCSVCFYKVTEEKKETAYESVSLAEQDLIINTDSPYSVRINTAQSALPPCLLHLLPLQALNSTDKTFSVLRAGKDPHRNKFVSNQHMFNCNQL